MSLVLHNANVCLSSESGVIFFFLERQDFYDDNTKTSLGF